MYTRLIYGGKDNDVAPATNAFLVCAKLEKTLLSPTHTHTQMGDIIRGKIIPYIHMNICISTYHGRERKNLLVK